LAFRLPRLLLQLVPQFVWHRLQSTELPRALQPFATVDGDDFSIDVSRKVGKQKSSQVGQFLMVAHALERHALFEIELFGKITGQQAFPRPFRGERPGRYSVTADTVFAPFYRQ